MKGGRDSVKWSVIYGISDSVPNHWNPLKVQKGRLEAEAQFWGRLAETQAEHKSGLTISA